MLYVKINGFIKNIEAQDWFSASDLFIELKYKDSKRRTTIIDNNNKPVWNEIFLFKINENQIEKSLINIKIMEQDNISKLVKEYNLKINHNTITKYTIDNLLDIDIGNVFEKHNKIHSDLLSKIKDVTKKNIDNLHILEKSK